MAKVQPKIKLAPVFKGLNINAMKKCDSETLNSKKAPSFDDALYALYYNVHTVKNLLNKQLYGNTYVVEGRFALVTHRTGSSLIGFVDLTNGFYYSLEEKSFSSFSDFVEHINTLADEALPVGIVLPSRNSNGVFLSSGDDTSNDSYSDQCFLSIPNKKYYTISIRCMARMFSKNSEAEFEALEEAVLNGLMVQDATRDEILKVDSKIATAYSNWRKGLNTSSNDFKIFASQYKSPSLGFVLRQCFETLDWHRSPYIVLKLKTNGFLFGVDESAYFGCELPEVVNTAKGAFDVLVPEQAKVKGALRQGEWFAVPVNSKEVPYLLDCDLSVSAKYSEYEQFDHENGETYEGDGISLPVENETSARHLIFSDEEILIKDGKIFAFAPRVVHSRGEHADMVGDNRWYTFVRNTAGKSVGEANVD